MLHEVSSFLLLLCTTWYQNKRCLALPFPLTSLHFFPVSVAKHEPITAPTCAHSTQLAGNLTGGGEIIRNVIVAVRQSISESLTLVYFTSFSRCSWCYVSNATCTNAIASVESPGLFYSYFGPCGIDTTQINATNCPLHRKWDDVSKRGGDFLEHLISHTAKGAVAECAEEEEEDKTELKALSLLLGISIVGAGVGVLICVWVIRCDPAETRDWLYETLCLWSSQSDKASEAEDYDLNPNEQPTFPLQSKSKLLNVIKPVPAVGTSKRDVAALSSGTSSKRNLATVTD